MLHLKDLSIDKNWNAASFLKGYSPLKFSKIEEQQQ